MPPEFRIRRCGMGATLQKAGLWKRFAAFLLDFILISILSVGVGSLVSVMTGYDALYDEMTGYYTKYSEEYGLPENLHDITETQYEEFSDELKEKYDAATKALSEDPGANKCWTSIINSTLLIISIGLFISVLILEFLVPLLFGNGQTVGKKIFSLGVIFPNGVKVTTAALFVRSMLGKYTLELMVPALVLILICFGGIGVLGIAVLGLILLLEGVLIVATKNNSMIHDLISYTAVADMTTQRVFRNEDELIAYIKALELDRARTASDRYNG